MPPIIVLPSAKRVATQMFVTEKLNGLKKIIVRGFICDIIRTNKKLPE